MLTSTPGSGRPAWVRAAVVTSSSDQSRMRSWGQAIEASGDVSVMPQAWMMRRPNSSAYRSMRERGGWAPPQTMWRRSGSPPPRRASSSATPSHTVGTPAATVTRSAASRSRKAAGSRAPAKKTCLAPTAVAA